MQKIFKLDTLMEVMQAAAGHPILLPLQQITQATPSRFSSHVVPGVDTFVVDQYTTFVLTSTRSLSRITPVYQLQLCLRQPTKGHFPISVYSKFLVTPTTQHSGWHQTARRMSSQLNPVLSF
jgi:hypothetical protein